jgi:thioredoxin 2
MTDQTTTIECESCNKSNRVPLARLKDKPKCGECGTLLPLGGGPIALTDENFESVVSTSPVPIVVDFWAPWCGPCRMIGPVLETIAGEKPYDVLIAKLNVDENPRTAARFQVRSIPMLVAFHDGDAIDTQIGALPAAALRSWVDRAIGRAQLH